MKSYFKNTINILLLGLRNFSVNRSAPRHQSLFIPSYLAVITIF